MIRTRRRQTLVDVSAGACVAIRNVTIATVAREASFSVDARLLAVVLAGSALVRVCAKETTLLG